MRNISHTATILLCCFPWQIVVESSDRCVGLVGIYKTKALFEQADSDDREKVPRNYGAPEQDASEPARVLRF